MSNNEPLPTGKESIVFHKDFGRGFVYGYSKNMFHNEYFYMVVFDNIKEPIEIIETELSKQDLKNFIHS